MEDPTIPQDDDGDDKNPKEKCKLVLIGPKFVKIRENSEFVILKLVGSCEHELT